MRDAAHAPDLRAPIAIWCVGLVLLAVSIVGEARARAAMKAYVGAVAARGDPLDYLRRCRRACGLRVVYRVGFMALGVGVIAAFAEYFTEGGSVLGNVVGGLVGLAILAAYFFEQLKGLPERVTEFLIDELRDAIPERDDAWHACLNANLPFLRDVNPGVVEAAFERVRRRCPASSTVIVHP